MESQNLSLEYIRRQPRWDFRYFEPKYLEAERIIKESIYPVEPLEKHVGSIVNFGAYSLCNLLEWVDEGVPYIRVTDIKEDGISWATVPHIPAHVHEQLPKSKVFPGDVLYSMAGTIGLATVAPPDLGECNSNQAIAKIRLKAGELDPYYLAAFLNSQLGKHQSERVANGQTVLNINLGEIGSLLVPIPPPSVQNYISTTMQAAYEACRIKLDEARKLLADIDSELLSELGIKLSPARDIKRFVVQSSTLRGQRFDVGPYTNQFNARDLENVKTAPLHTLADLPRTTLTASRTPDAEFIYIGMADVDEITGKVNGRHLLGEEINSNKIVIRGGDVVFARIEPCIYNRKVALIPRGIDEALGSTELLVVRANSEVLPEYLHWILRSEFIQRQIVGKMTGTTGRRRLPNRAFADLQIPLVSTDAQLNICQRAEELKQLAAELEQKASEQVSQIKSLVEGLFLGKEDIA